MVIYAVLGRPRRRKDLASPEDETPSFPEGVTRGPAKVVPKPGSLGRCLLDFRRAIPGEGPSVSHLTHRVTRDLNTLNLDSEYPGGRTIYTLYRDLKRPLPVLSLELCPSPSTRLPTTSGSRSGPEAWCSLTSGGTCTVPLSSRGRYTDTPGSLPEPPPFVKCVLWYAGRVTRPHPI